MSSITEIYINTRTSTQTQTHPQLADQIQCFPIFYCGSAEDRSLPGINYFQNTSNGVKVGTFRAMGSMTMWSV